MVDLTVRGRFEGDASGLVGAAKQSAAAVKSVGDAASAAAPKVGDALNPPRAGGGANPSEDLRKMREELDRALGSADRSFRATQRITTAQETLTRAYKAGAIGQAEYDQRLANLTGRLDTVEQATARQALTWESLAKGNVRMNAVLQSGAVLLTSFAGGLVAAGASALIDKAATELLAAAYRELAAAVDSTVRVENLLASVRDKAKLKQEELKLTSEELRKAYAAETEGLVLLMKQAKELSAWERGLSTLPGGSLLIRFRRTVEDRTGQTAADRESAETLLRAERGEFNDGARGAPENRADQSLHYRKPTGTPPIVSLLTQMREESAKARAQLTGDSGSIGAAYAELEVKLKTLKAGTKDATEAKRLFWDAFQTKGDVALKAYAEETAKQQAVLQAEIAGHKDLIPLIELEFQLRQQYGTKFAQNQGRITALAAERAAMERLRIQWQGTTQFLETSAEQAGTLIHATLGLSFRHSADDVRAWQGTTMSALQAVYNELQKLLIINPLLNSFFGGTRPTGYGEGGLVSEFLKSIGFGSSYQSVYASSYANPAYAPPFHGGGRVGEAPVGMMTGQVKFLPDAMLRNARRAHGGLGPDEMPIVAKRGEGVFTPRQMDNADAILRLLMQLVSQGGGGGAPPAVNIFDQRAANAPPVETRQRGGAGGRIEVDVIVREGGRKAIGSGDWDSAMQTRYGIVPVAAR